ncbi:MAG: DVU_1551 family NTP transferase [Roseiarcus sp.]
MPRRAEADATSEIAAVVLAAGRSSRMGAFKPLLPFGEGTVLGHVAARLREAGIRRIHAVYGYRAEIMTPALAHTGIVGVLNPDFDKGMYTSVRAGVASLPASAQGCLIWPVDVPLVRPETLKRVLAAAAESGGAVVHPAFRGERGHPPYIPRSLFDEIFHGDGEGGLRAVLARHEGEAREIAVFDRGCLCDMDHPEDYRRLREALARQHVPDDWECEAMLDAMAVGEPIRRHCRAVAAFATRLAERLKAAGVPLDVDLVRAAALVHDIAKGKPRHAEAGAALLCECGFPNVANVVACHMAISFDGEHIDEGAVVYLADKLVRGATRVSLEERFAQAFAHFASDPAALAGARQRYADAQAILCAVEAHGGLPDLEAAPATTSGRALAAMEIGA